MNNIVKNAIIMYYTPTEQMNNALTTANKEQQRYNKEYTNRQEFLKNIMGKSLYKKCCNNGALNTFAPIPFSALKCNCEDFCKLESVNNLINDKDCLNKLYSYIAISYPKNTFKVYDNILRTDLVFNTLDSIIDFFYILLKGINKSYKVKLTENDINWRPICKKFNEYLS